MHKTNTSHSGRGVARPDRNEALPEVNVMTGEWCCAYGKGTMKIEITATPAAEGEMNGVMPEFGRHYHVFKLFGIKRGLLHLLVTEGKIKSVLIRRKGNVHGTRYYHLASISTYLHSQMAEQLQKPGE